MTTIIVSAAWLLLLVVLVVRLALLAEIARQDIPYRNPDYNPVPRLLVDVRR